MTSISPNSLLSRQLQFRAEIFFARSSDGTSNCRCNKIADDISKEGVLVLGRHRGRRVGRHRLHAADAAVDQHDADGAHHHAGDRQRIQLLAEQRERRARRSPPAPDRTGWQSRSPPSGGSANTSARPRRSTAPAPARPWRRSSSPLQWIDAGLEGEGGQAEQRQRAGILHRVAGAPVDAAAIALLVERAERDADSEPKLAIQPSGEPAATMLRSCSTSATPIRPSSRPSHCRRVTARP